MQRKLLIALLAGAALVGFQSAASADVIYNSLPPTGIHTNSQAYQAQQMSEFGDEITFAGDARNLTSVTVGLVNFATQAQYGSFGDATGYQVPLTLTLYNVGAGDTLGSAFATETIDATILWDTDGNGHTQDVTFDFSGVSLPDSVIFGLSFNTETWGPNPTGVDGPYDALNFGLNNADGAPSVGTDDNPSGVWLNTATGGWGDHTPGTFSQDTIGYPDNFGLSGCTTPADVCADAWTGRPPSIEFEAVPEPSTLALLGGALLGFGFLARKRWRKATV